ncbi:hypothetical protein [Parasitella parasitica]|uniref:Nitrogen regulatory protein areA GATA-like domain-containing protein n=1 Tax=Parasitella parasitica TaxID=35722 RepID=A0A0B7NPS0_9FUNG|nr:hypothetical protein [Parasitella parasitica]
MEQQQKQQSFLSLSCSNLNSSENQLGTMWGAFNKCKPFIENGTRLENISWRLWQYQRQPTNKIDNTTIKRFITSVLLSPANVHDAYSHEVPQPRTQKCYEPTTIMPPHEPKSATSSFIVLDANKPERKPDAKNNEDDYEDDEDYYLSDDLYDDDDEDLYDDDDEDEQDVANQHKQQQQQQQRAKEESQFINDFKKTQPRPTTPRRSLLSDLLGRVSPPPSLLSNSTCSFTTANSLMEDESSSASSSSSTASTTSSNENKNTSKIALNPHPFVNTTSVSNATNDPSQARWRESFHGW